MTEEPLPGMPPAVDGPPGTVSAFRVYASRVHPRTRQLCSDCTADIHRLGIGLAALPAPVRWRYHKGALTLLLCEAHKNDRLMEDS